MITRQMINLVRQVRSGELDQAQISTVEHLSATEFVQELRSKYLVLFQERRVGHKYEIGLARSVSLELARRQLPNSHLSLFFFMPVLRQCMFVSSYDDRITEVTTVASIQVIPGGGDSVEITLRMGLGHKLDKRPDGWFLKKLKKRPVTLSEAFLSARGWNFKVFDIKTIE
jgi:hypothetical protein